MGSEEVIGAWLARFMRRRESGATEAQEAQPDRAAAIGGLGEALVAGRLRELGWPVLRNVVLRDRGGSAEIDLLARAPGGLMVLEVKNLVGADRGDGVSRIMDAAWIERPRDDGAKRDPPEPGACGRRRAGDRRWRDTGIRCGRQRGSCALRGTAAAACRLGGCGGWGSTIAGQGGAAL